MENNEKIKFLEHTMQRFDFYINSTNNKASIIIGFNSILLGATFFKFHELINLFPCIGWPLYLATTIIFMVTIISSVSLLLSFRVIVPFLQSGEEYGKYTSLKFFEPIAKMKEEDYIEKIKKLNDSDAVYDLSKQSHILAKGLSVKMVALRKSTKCILLCLFLLIILFFLKFYCI